MSEDCSTDLFNSTRPLYTYQPVIANKENFTTVTAGLAVLNLLLGVYIVITNCCVVVFYCNKVKQVVPLLYTFIASNDILTGN